MEKGKPVKFTVQVFSVNNATWQGEVESNGEAFTFESEIQLLKWLCKKYPQLMPEIGNGFSKG